MTQQQIFTTIIGEVNSFVDDGYRIIIPLTAVGKNRYAMSLRHTRNNSRLFISFQHGRADIYRDKRLVKTIS